MSEEWLNNPKLKNISKEKLELLKQLAAQGSTKDKNSMLPFLMNAQKQSKQKGLNFTPDEISVMIDAMKVGKSKAEIAKMDKLINMMTMMNKK